MARQAGDVAEAVWAATRALGPLPGLTPPQKLKALAEEVREATGWCAFAGIEAVFIVREDGLWGEYHAVAFGNGGWTNSGRGKWIGAHEDTRRTAEGLRYPDPRGRPMKLRAGVHNGNMDTTLLVYNSLDYCRAIRHGRHGTQPRASCPVRPEGHEDREAWERLLLGDQAHWCDGEPMEWFRGNPATAKGRCQGTYRTCSEDGSICHEEVFP